MIKFEKITTSTSVISNEFLKRVQERANDIDGDIINITFGNDKLLGSAAVIWYDYPSTKKISEEEKEQLKGVTFELKTFSDAIHEETTYIRDICSMFNISLESLQIIERPNLNPDAQKVINSKKNCITKRCYRDVTGAIIEKGGLLYYDTDLKALLPLFKNQSTKNIIPGVYTNFQAPERSLDEMVILESNYFDAHFEDLGLVLVEDTSLFPEIATIEDCVVKGESDTDGSSKTLYRKWDDVHCKCPYYFSQKEETFVPLYPCEKNNYIGKVNMYSSKEYNYMKPFVEVNLLEKIEFLDLPHEVKKYMAKNKNVYHKHVWIDRYNHLNNGAGKMYYYSAIANMLIGIDV